MRVIRRGKEKNFQLNNFILNYEKIQLVFYADGSLHAVVCCVYRL